LLFGFDNPILLAKIYLNPTYPGTKTVRLSSRGLHFRVRGAMDVWSIKETFLDRFYEKYGFTIQPNWKIIDIGAGIGLHLHAGGANRTARFSRLSHIPNHLFSCRKTLF
jgi:hypothetical protein